MAYDDKDNLMPTMVEAMTKQQLWNWFSRSSRAAAESANMKERWFTSTTGLHPAQLRGDPYEIIELQRRRLRGLEQQMAQMQKGYDKKLKKAIAATKDTP